MCTLCEDNDGEYEECQDCLNAICYDAESQDDWPRRAYVTASGDLFCILCGKQYDELEDAEYDDDPDGYRFDPFDIYISYGVSE